MKEYVTSKEVINYLKDNLAKKNYLTMFVAGSIPEELLPKSDLDIFFIIKGENKNDFFDNLDNLLGKFVRKVC